MEITFLEKNNFFLHNLWCFDRAGFSFGFIHVTWYDLWEKRFCFEIIIYNFCVVTIEREEKDNG